VTFAFERIAIVASWCSEDY